MKNKIIKFCIALLLFSACDPSSQINSDQLISRNILGGQLVTPENPLFKTTVLINLTHNENHSSVYCSGTLISKKFVLTAAHCFKDRNAISVQSASGDQTQVENVFIHPEYSREKAYDRYDIALVEIAPHPAFHTFAVLTDKIPKIGDRVSIAGYGRTQIDRESSKKLNSVDLKMASDQFMPSEALIAEEALQGSCFGDSGGPAYYVENQKIYIWGVDSRAPQISGARCGKYEIYTKVYGAQDWILQVTDLR